MKRKDHQHRDAKHQQQEGIITPLTHACSNDFTGSPCSEKSRIVTNQQKQQQEHVQQRKHRRVKLHIQVQEHDDKAWQARQTETKDKCHAQTLNFAIRLAWLKQQRHK